MHPMDLEYGELYEDLWLQFINLCPAYKYSYFTIFIKFLFNYLLTFFSFIIIIIILFCLSRFHFKRRNMQLCTTPNPNLKHSIPSDIPAHISFLKYSLLIILILLKLTTFVNIPANSQFENTTTNRHIGSTRICNAVPCDVAAPSYIY